MASHELERDLTKASVGYLSKDEYKRKREELERDKAIQALKRVTGAPAATDPAASTEAAAADAPPSESKKKKKKKDKGGAGGALSFGDELEAEGEGVSPGAIAKGGLSAFRVREKEAEAVRQEAVMRGILEQQQRAREERLSLKYTFRSETTQREVTVGYLDGEVSVKRGCTADEVAVAVRTEVEKRGGKFEPLSVGGVRDERDVILCCCCLGAPQGTFAVPGAVGLVELSTRKWADTNASMFDDFAHGIIVTERRYYEAMKHTYPFSHWRPYESRDAYAWSEFIRTRGSAYKPLEPIRPAAKYK